MSEEMDFSLLNELSLDDLLALQTAIEKKLAADEALYEELLQGIDVVVTPGYYELDETLYGCAVQYIGENDIVCVLRGKTANMAKFLRGFRKL